MTETHPFSPGEHSVDDPLYNESTESVRRNLFTQQTLKAQQVFFEISSWTVFFFVTGLGLLIPGLILYTHHSKLIIHELDYTHLHCLEKDCFENFTLQTSISKPVFMYYQINGLFQNHRRFLTSKSNDQLLGRIVKPSDLDSCKPLDVNPHNKMYLPCGAIANSLFSDNFELVYMDNASPHVVPASDQGIAWKSDIDRKYGLLSSQAFDNTVKPQNWSKSVADTTGKPFKSFEALMVWMRPALKSNFKKLYKIIQHKPKTPFADGLPAGNYSLKISGDYPVQAFKGKKAFVLANTGHFGAKNMVYPMLAMILGLLHMCLAIAFIFLPMMKRRKRRILQKALTMDRPVQL